MPQARLIAERGTALDAARDPEGSVPESRLSRATGVFKAVGHPARLRILSMLRPRGLCVCQITAILELAVSTVSAHLAELKRAGLVVEHREGRWVSYRLAQDHETGALLGRVWPLIDDDPRVDADGKLARGLRRISVEDLCRVGLDLARLGLKRPAWSRGRSVSCRRP